MITTAMYMYGVIVGYSQPGPEIGMFLFFDMSMAAVLSSS